MTPPARIATYAARRLRLAPATWGVPLGLLCLMIVAIFPSIEGSPQLDQLIDSYPDAFKEAFGVTDASFRTIEGYLAVEVFSLIAPLATAYFTIHALARAVCGSEQRGVLDIVLSAPVRRYHVLAGWLGAVASVLVAILVVTGVICQLAAVAFGVDLAIGSTVAGVANLWPLSVFFGGLTLLLAGVSSRTLAVTGVATATLVTMYFLEVLGKLSSAAATVDGLSAFHYYGSAIENGIDPAAFVGLTAAGLLLAAAGAALFERRDVRA
jgi:ABC-2 type transport system permease protein